MKLLKMGKEKNNKMNIQSKREMEIFENNGQTMMYPLFIINKFKMLDSAKVVHYVLYESSLFTGYCDLTDQYIHEQTGVSLSAIAVAIKALKQEGWIKAEMIPNASGCRRRIYICYDKIRRECPRKERRHEEGKFRGLAKRTKFFPEAVATYVICNIYGQTFMSLKPIIYDTDLKPRSKVLSQIICSLSHFKGYCYAGDTFLSKKLDVTEQTISTHVGILENEGIIYVENNGRRHIYMNYPKLRRRYLKKK